ncbi:MAG: hypothetical protein PWP03_811, partial [Candidatus Woesearchaeota archaeon]|nr:hypothetical protein [Candidatus Woesearchaeota archaeon]
MDFNFSSLRRNVVITLFISLVSLIFLFALVSAINSSNSSLNSSSQTIAVNNSEILNQNNLKQDLTDNSYESIKTKLSLGYYSIVSLERQPIIFGKPVEWFLTVSDGLYTYLVEFQTSPIFLKEYDNKDNSTWNKTLVLYTNYSGVYKDVEVNVSLPSDNFVVVPALNYTYSDNVLSLLIPELNKSTKIVIVGSFSNESINLSQLNVSLNVSINESLFNEEEVNSLSNSVFATDKEQYFVNDTVNFVLLQNISGYSIYVDTPSGNTLYVENTSLKVSEPGDHLATLIFNGSYYSLRFKVVSRSRTSFENGFGVFNITSSSGVVENFFVDDDLNIFFRIGNLSLGQKVAVNILLPFQIPEGVYFYVWKDSGKGKIKVPFNLSDSRDRITLFLQDGVIDDDGLINGIIEDPLKLFIPNYNVNVSKINKNEAHIEISHRKVKLTSKGGDLKQTHVVDPLNLPSTPVSPDKFKYKLLKFRIENVSSGSSDIILNYESLPERFELWKFNPNTLEWYNFPYERINDTAIKITIFDGGFGDDDGIKNGIIEDDLGITYQWWNDSWPWRRAYNISNTAGDLTDFQVKLNFNSTNFNFSKTNSDGSDLRFTYYNASSDSETKLNYWIEYFNATQQQVIVWIKVPYLQNNTNTTIFV